MANNSQFVSEVENVHFTSDVHFGHKNIIRYCNRPFKDVDDMDEQLIQRWNSVVKPDDVPLAKVCGCTIPGANSPAFSTLP